MWFDCVCIKYCVFDVFSIKLFAQSPKTDDQLNEILLVNFYAINHNILKFCCFFDDCVNMDQICSIFLLFFVHWLCKSHFACSFYTTVVLKSSKSLQLVSQKLVNCLYAIKTVNTPKEKKLQWYTQSIISCWLYVIA